MVHGVSLGEVMLMRPLVPRLEAALGRRCLLTTSTETGAQALAQHFPGHERAFLPFDLPWAVERFLRRARPAALILLELELWPGLLAACHGRGIPVALVNARVSARSYRGYRRLGFLLRPLLRRVRLALGQNGLWTARLAALGVARDRARCTGSMKADMVARATPDAALAEAQRLGLGAGRPLLLVASTGPGEEVAVLGGRARAWTRRGWSIVVCPRHPERGAELAQQLAAAEGLAVRRSSQRERARDASDIVVVDEIGRLGALYALCAQRGGIAVVGGSLGSGRGGQNMLEAAAAGCCTVVGPDTRNFPDAMALLRAADGVVEADPADGGPAGLAATLDALAADAARRATLGGAARRAWAAGQGATERAVEALAAALRRGDRGV